jgi:hypothetical protein
MTFFRHVPILWHVSGLAASHASHHSPPKHIALLCVLENQYQLVDTVHLVLNALDERAKCVGDVVDERIADPIRRDRDVILEVLDASPDVLRVRRAPKVELEPSAPIASSTPIARFRRTHREGALAEDDDVHVERLEIGLAVRVLVKRSETNEVVVSEQLDLFASLLEQDVFGCERVDAKHLSRQRRIK